MPLGQQIEEQLASRPIEGDEAQLVQDQQRHALDLVGHSPQPPLVPRLEEVSDEVSGAGVEDALSSSRGLDAQRSRARKRARSAGVKKLESAIEPGDPAQVIIERSKEFDMVVMGRRGLGPIKGLLQGSVSQKVGQLADAACATVK